MRWRPVVFGTVGLLATAVAVLVVFAPDIWGHSLVAVLGTVEPRTALVLASVGIGFCATLAGWLFGGTDVASASAFDVVIDNPPEAVTTAEGQLVAAAVDTAVDDALSNDPEAMEAVVSRLRGTATTAYATAAGVSHETAEQAVLTGTWTDDDVATALLAPETAHSLISRLRLWLDPESERERRIRRTVTAIERVAGGEY